MKDERATDTPADRLPGRSDARNYRRGWRSALTDRELVEQTLAGDREAFGRLVVRHEESLMRYVLHMGFDHARARDILQDAFVRAYRHLGRCGDPDRFDGWLFRITANLCRTAGRKAAKRTMTDLESVTLKEEGPGPEERAERASLRERLRERLDRLPEDQRESLVLFYLQELPVRRIAELTGVSESAVKMRLKRGRERLREELRFMEDEAGER